MTYHVKLTFVLRSSCAGQTYMLGPVLDGVGELRCQSCIFLQRLAPLDCASNGMCDDSALLLLNQQFRAGSNNLEIFAIYVEEIG